MDCPNCQKCETQVIDSRVNENNEIRRRRECSCCRFRFTTFERVEPSKAIIIKKDGSEEPFSRDKIIRGLLRAANKTDLTKADIENIAQGVEQEIFEKGDEKISSQEVGNLVMKKLKEADEIAYLRFASVYQEFGDLETFEKEIEKLK